MDPATLIGIGAALLAIFGAMIMEGGSPMEIILIPPLILVFVGTFGVGIAGGLMDEAKAIPGSLQKALLKGKQVEGDIVATIVHLAEKARREGLLALEDAMRDIDDPFLKKGLELAVDGTDPDGLAEILDAEIDGKRVRDTREAKIFNDMGGYAPTIGIIGTVIGLVGVLGNLENPSELGHMIAGAFVATLWGVLSANVFWLPIGNKLKRVSDAECAQMSLIVEGILAIQSGANPRMVDRKLRALLPSAPAAEKKKAA